MNEQFIQSNGLTLAYDEFGHPDHPALVLIMGLGSQMVQWPPALCKALASHGYRVIRFDNRDIGLSEKIETSSPPNILSMMALKVLGFTPSAPYDLHDMAQDAIGLLDALELDAAHWVGVSMGGMIGQCLAATFPERCRSLTSIMSSSGNPRLPQASLKIQRQLLKSPPTHSQDAYIDHVVTTRKMFASPGFPITDEELKQRVELSFHRNVHPAGFRNQMAAILKTGDRRALLKRINTPTLVIHGHDDALVPVEAGIDTAKHIPTSTLHLIEGMGHDLAPGVCEAIEPLIVQHITRHDETSRAA